MKKLVLWITLALINLAILEFGSALVLYHWWAQRPADFVSTGNLAPLATLDLVQRVGRRLGLNLPWSTAASPILTSVPSPFFVPDPALGYIVRPGSYEIVMELKGQRYEFHASVDPDGSRATSYQPQQAEKNFYIFGDSYTWGWPNEDQHTFAWLLQQKFDEYYVRNFAQNGYGNIHALVQLSKMKNSVASEDTILLIYGDYFNVRNVAAPSRLRHFARGRDQYAYSTSMTHPKGVVDGGELSIEYVPLLCDASDGYCDQQDPSPEDMYDVSKAVFAKIFDMFDARIIVGYIQGPDKYDAVLEFVEEQGVEIVDLRPSSVAYEADDLEPFDAHPGPISHFNYFRKMKDYLMMHGKGVQP